MGHSRLDFEWVGLRGWGVQRPREVKLFKGASLNAPKGLFNAGLDAKATRAIDFAKDEKIDEPALKSLVRAAVAHNQVGGSKKK